MSWVGITSAPDFFLFFSYILLSLSGQLHPSSAQLPGEYPPAYTFQCATGNLSTIAISLYSQVFIYVHSWTFIFEEEKEEEY